MLPRIRLDRCIFIFRFRQGEGSAKVSEWAAKDSECRRKDGGAKLSWGRTKEKKKEKTRQTPAMRVCSQLEGGGTPGEVEVLVCSVFPPSSNDLRYPSVCLSVCLFGWMGLGRPTEENFSLSFSFAYFPPVAFGSPI